MRQRRKYLVDTNMLSYAINADWHKPESYPHWISRRLRVNLDRCYLPSIVVQEITYGIHHAQIGERRRARVFKWLRRFKKLAFDDEAARIAGQLRADLERKGKSVAEADIQIAAIALRYNLILLTRNVKHFADIPNLKFENWAELPMSIETFFLELISGSVRVLKTVVAVVLVFVVFFHTVKPTSYLQISEWVLPFFLSVAIYSVIAGTVLGLSTRALVAICILLQRRHII